MFITLIGWPTGRIERKQFPTRQAARAWLDRRSEVIARVRRKRGLRGISREIVTA